jgi:hypothetical protein
MEVKGLGFFHGNGIAPHVLRLGRRTGLPPVTSSMDNSRDDAKTMRDFVDVKDLSENAKAGTVGEVIRFARFLATQKALQRAKTLVVTCFAHWMTPIYITYLCQLPISRVTGSRLLLLTGFCPTEEGY